MQKLYSLLNPTNTNCNLTICNYYPPPSHYDTHFKSNTNITLFSGNIINCQTSIYLKNKSPLFQPDPKVIKGTKEIGPQTLIKTQTAWESNKNKYITLKIKEMN